MEAAAGLLHIIVSVCDAKSKAYWLRVESLIEVGIDGAAGVSFFGCFYHSVLWSIRKPSGLLNLVGFVKVGLQTEVVNDHTVKRTGGVE